MDWVSSVGYGDRLGSDFDHREVIIKLGRRNTSPKVTIFDSTLNDAVAYDQVLLSVLENLARNFVNVD